MHATESNGAEQLHSAMHIFSLTVITWTKPHAWLKGNFQGQSPLQKTVRKCAWCYIICGNGTFQVAQNASSAGQISTGIRQMLSSYYTVSAIFVNWTDYMPNLGWFCKRKLCIHPSKLLLSAGCCGSEFSPHPQATYTARLCGKHGPLVSRWQWEPGPRTSTPARET